LKYNLGSKDLNYTKQKFRDQIEFFLNLTIEIHNESERMNKIARVKKMKAL
jgi:hypothetical protein